MKRRSPWLPVYAAALALFTAYVLLDTFVIPRQYAAADAAAAVQQASADTSETLSSAPVVTGDSYTDANVSVKITRYREYDTDIYAADISLADASSLKTAFADDIFGKNITAAASDIARAHGAILAINGDYCGTRTGYVIRNGTLYRSVGAGGGRQDLAIYADGSFGLANESDSTAQQLLDGGALQVLSFGPGLLDSGELIVGSDSRVAREMASNPRTAIGLISPLHYLFVVSDGRTPLSAGLSLYELASFMKELGVQTAYNLDGGGSSTMVFNGSVVNRPTANGSDIKERRVSDIVYIG